MYSVPPRRSMLYTANIIIEQLSLFYVVVTLQYSTPLYEKKIINVPF